MLATIMGTPFQKNIYYLRRKFNISVEDMARQMDMSTEDYVEQFEEKREQRMAVFDDEQLHLLCEILCTSPILLIEMDIEEMETEYEGDEEERDAELEEKLSSLFLF